ncbi:SpaA isopeptide-forming pilin-related protein [uncultured Ruminococcus sp.]|uniref:SpaA isopeptide-forming pilin-related protein n=1 Tax=uncultured Ruminococcus sp. TaxID=165186 RepID=UPI0025E7B9C8|nr:SpaA isopeptide-forming pilin-related protein [uncultured Ruminococcus sp.]
MKKMFKRTTAIAASALMIGQMVPFNVFADQTNGLTDLRIHPYVLDEAKYKQAKEAEYIPQGDGVTDRSQANKYGTEDTSITFDIVEVNTDGSVKEGGYHDEGKTEFADLPNAFYKIVPNRENHTDARFKDAESFYVHLPAVVSGVALFDVDIYPKLTENNDTGNDSTDPDTPIDDQDPNYDPNEPKTNNKHAIKLQKKLQGSDTWDTSLNATFKIYYQNTLDKWVEVGDFDTDDNGIIQVDGLPLGTYYAIETEAPEGYLLDQTPIKFELDGTGVISKQFKTFTNDKELKVAKEVITSGDNTGLHYKWKITADVPEKTENLLSYTITDKYTNLNITNIAIDGFTEGSDYTVTNDTATGTVTIVFTEDGIAKLSGSSIEIIVTSDNASTGDVANSAAIAYKYAFNPPADDPNTPDDDIYKVIPDPDTDPSYPTEKNYPVDPDNPPAGTHDEFTPATITISNVDANNHDKELKNGKYEVSRCSPYDDDNTTNVVTLENLAPGVYTIKQLATESGYYVENDVNKNTKTIFIDKDGKVYEGTDNTGTELTAKKVIFYNDATISGFDLPFTGTTATIVFTIAGIGVMGGALFFFIFFKKRDKDEEEKENA